MKLPYFVRKLSKDKLACLSVVVLIGLFLCILLAPFISPYDPIEQQLSLRRQGPNFQHWAGNDEAGRDILSRLIFGAKNTLILGMLSMSIGLLFGIILGLISGYYKGLLDTIIMRLMDLMLAFPYFLFAILIVAMLGPGLTNAAISIGVASVPTYARVVRGSVLGIREKPFIQAVQALGSGDFRVIFHHILPNVLAPVIVIGTLGIARGILAGAGLGFLGLGAQPPAPEWGAMLGGGRAYLVDAPHICLFPGLALVILVLSLNLFGDALRDILDPKLK
jgi:ABC-type dipeptide/oligopeptide/nickel transport system permease subunit